MLFGDDLLRRASLIQVAQILRGFREQPLAERHDLRKVRRHFRTDDPIDLRQAQCFRERPHLGQITSEEIGLVFAEPQTLAKVVAGWLMDALAGTERSYGNPLSFITSTTLMAGYLAPLIFCAFK
jgi:hypothetical protein